jgi:hypothetical protein
VAVLTKVWKSSVAAMPELSEPKWKRPLVSELSEKMSNRLSVAEQCPEMAMAGRMLMVSFQMP